MKSNAGSVGTRIKQRREELNLSQDELATKLGYKSRSTIAKIEKGNDDLSQSKIEKFATALDTTPGWLLGGALIGAAVAAGAGAAPAVGVGGLACSVGSIGSFFSGLFGASKDHKEVTPFDSLERHLSDIQFDIEVIKGKYAARDNFLNILLKDKEDIKTAIMNTSKDGVMKLDDVSFKLSEQQITANSGQSVH